MDAGGIGKKIKVLGGGLFLFVLSSLFLPGEGGGEDNTRRERRKLFNGNNPIRKRKKWYILIKT